MPYIPQVRRPRLHIQSERPPESAGELNYQFTLLINQFFHRHGVSYSAINCVIGALECAKLELYRRVAAPYEDAKCGENGDVYNQ